MSGETATAEQTVSPADKTAVLEALATRATAGDWDDVARQVDAYATAGGDDPEVKLVGAFAAFVADDYVNAARIGEAAFEAGAQSAEAAEFLGVLYAQLGNVNDALYYMKMGAALPNSPALAQLVPADLPALFQEFSQMRENPLQQRGFVAMQQQDWAAAEHWFRQHLAFHPDSRESVLGLAQSLMIFERFEEAVDVLRAARHVLPWDAYIASTLGTCLTAIGNLAEGQASHRWAMDAAPQDPTLHAAAAVDALADPVRGAADLAATFRAWGERFGAESGFGGGGAKATPRDRLTVGYLIGGMGRRPEADALASLLAEHDSTRFRTVGFGAGALTMAQNVTFQKAFDTWHDIRHIDPITVGAMVRAEAIDILVDLGGFATPELLTAMGSRLAPAQVAWLNAPYGTGIANIDYLIADAILDRDGQLAELAGETVLHLETGAVLPAHPVPRDGDSETIAPPETEASVTFGSDISLAELNPEVAETFARILHGVPDSQLLLADHGFRSDQNTARLIALFGNFGVAHRVDVASNLTSTAFFRQVDIALTPFPRARPECAVSALSAGVPTITLAGERPDARQVGSLLHHAGLDEELVAATPEAYVGLAVAWAQNAGRRQAFAGSTPAKLAAASPKVQCAALEKLLEEAWQRSCTAAGT